MSYVPALPPREHQVKALERIAGKPSSPSDEDVFALLMEMGTGKTKVGLDEFGMREEAGDIQDLLVVAPAGSYTNWFMDKGEEFPSEFRKHLSEDLFDRLLVASWRSGAGKGAREVLRQVLSTRDKRRPRALVVNIEALSSVKDAIEACREFLSASGRRSLMIVDESTRIKSQSASRTKTVCELGELADARRIMSGLVTPHSPLDLYSQFKFLDWRIIGSRSWWGFRSRYAILQQKEFRVNDTARNVKVVVGFRNIEELHERIAPYSYRVLKSECLDLPPKQYAIRDVPLTPEQKRMYLEMREFATAQLDRESFVTATIVLTQRLRLDQLLCGFVQDDEGNIREVPEYRTRALLEVLDEHSGKAIIWTSHDYCVRKISKILREEYGEHSVAQFWGGNRGTRDEDEIRFKTDPRCRFMVATQAAGGVGNTWTVATLNVYYNNTDNLEHRLQSEDRNHRDGQTESVLNVDLCAANTIDEKKIKALRNKINIATAINGDNYREWLV